MIDTKELAKTVQLNCHISDAKYAGYYSLCVFLLKMREYYRWEQKIPLSEPLTKSDVGEWLSQREIDWQDYENFVGEKEVRNTLKCPFKSYSLRSIAEPYLALTHRTLTSSQCQTIYVL